MERQNCRREQKNRRFQCDTLDFSSNERDIAYNDKIKYKKRVHSDKKKFEPSQNAYLPGWAAQPRMQPFGQRSYSTTDSSICHYSVPVSFSFEPVSLPIYSALIQPQRNCSMPLDVESHFNKSSHHKSLSKHRRSKTNSMNEVPAIFHTPRVNNRDQQDYTSLPPVNCEMYGPKSSDNEATCKRRFSDPGIGQVSSDDCTSSGSEGSSKSSVSPEYDSQDFFSLFKQVNELKESNSHLRKELQETKLELETLKVNSQVWKTDYEDFKPGALSDAIYEIRNAVKLGEEALISKVTQMLEKTTAECNEMQSKIEEKLRQEMEERIGQLEKKLRNSSQRDEASETDTSLPESHQPAKEDLSFQQQLAELEQEKLQLRKELQEAVTKRKTAEATTEKLERLVGVLRKKINGVSLESSMPDEKQCLVRPLGASLEKNPFIIANNRQGQKGSEVSPFQKAKLSPFRSLAAEGADVATLGPNDNKENETVEASGHGEASHSPVTDTVTAQVTITGPVTDL